MTKFYDGQKVIITDDTCGHRLDLGRVVTLDTADICSDGSWDLWAEGRIFDQDDCEPIEEE
jgi:hypothetical protein